MTLDAPLAPARDADADQQPGTDAQTRLKIIDGGSGEWPVLVLRKDG